MPSGRDRHVSWHQIHPPTELDAEHLGHALRALAGVSGQPRLVLHATGKAGTVSWQMACERWALRRVLQALEHQLPGLRSTPLPDSFDGLPLMESAAARLRFRGDPTLPLAASQAEPVTRGVLGALARARSGERVVLQLLLGPRSRPGGQSVTGFRPSPANGPGEPLAERRKKRAEPSIECEIRCGASTGDIGRSRSLVDGVISALRPLEVPGVRLSVSRVRPLSVAEARSPLFWGNLLSVSDLVPLLAWPIGELPLPGVPAPHPRLLPVASAVPKTGRPLGVSTLDPERPVGQSSLDALRHLHVLGPNGVGKSTVLGRLALYDIQGGRGAVVIDPKGDLVEDLLARIPEGRRDDVVVLNATDKTPVGINGLATLADPDRAADSLLAVFSSLYAENWGPRTNDILHACLLTLARRGDASLVMVPLLLTNPGLRRSIIGNAAKYDPLGLGAFWSWFDGISEAERQNAIAPLMNKLRPVLLRPELRAVLGQRRPRFDLDEVFTHRRILLVNLSKGTIGSEAARLLGSVVVSLLWDATLRRIRVPANRRHPIMIYIDEVQDYLRLPGDLGDALAQARGLGVGFTLAHQHLAQLPPALREGVLANARSRIVFQTGARDAREFAAPRPSAPSVEDFQALPAFTAYASLLAGNSPTPWCSLSTQPLDPAIVSPRVVRQHSAERYGQPLDDIERDLLDLTGTGTGTPTPTDGAAGELFGRTARSRDASPGSRADGASS